VVGELAMPFSKTRMQIASVFAMGLIVTSIVGCSSKVEEHRLAEATDAQTKFIPESPLPDPTLLKPTASAKSDDDSTHSLDVSGLKGVLSGKWKMDDHTLEFSAGTTVFLNGFGSEKNAKYEFSKNVLKITTEAEGMRRASAALKPSTEGIAPNEYIYGVEFLSDREVSLRLEQSGEGFDWFQLAGRWKRIGLPADREQLRQSSGPVADAKRQVQRIEQKLTKLESVLNSALADRDDLAAKLRSLGVNSPADLKNNVRGMRLAENVVKLASEIDGLEQQLALIDGELLKAKSIVRRMERDQASLPEVELRNLATQLREVEERTDGTPLPVTPLDVDAAVEKALKGTTKTTSTKTSK
jgi:hypothetical protein